MPRRSVRGVGSPRGHTRRRGRQLGRGDCQTGGSCSPSPFRSCSERNGMELRGAVREWSSQQARENKDIWLSNSDHLGAYFGFARSRTIPISRSYDSMTDCMVCRPSRSRDSAFRRHSSIRRHHSDRHSPRMAAGKYLCRPHPTPARPGCAILYRRCLFTTLTLPSARHHPRAPHPRHEGHFMARDFPNEPNHSTNAQFS